MNKNMVLFFLVVALAGGFFAYQQGMFNKEIAMVEKNLNDICDPSKEDCTAFEEDLEA
jgi:hypothetical protein